MHKITSYAFFIITSAQNAIKYYPYSLRFTLLAILLPPKTDLHVPSQLHDCIISQELSITLCRT